MKWQQNSGYEYDPRASPPSGRPMRSRDAPLPPTALHHHRPRPPPPHGISHHQYPGPYRSAGYGQPRHPHPPPPPSRSYDYSRYYDYRHNSTYAPPPPPPPSHAPQYAAPPPSRHYGEASPEPRCSPPRDSPLGGSPTTLDPFRTGGCTCKKSRCLKLYCQCFSLSTTCGPKCKCQTCHNTTLHADAIEEARKTILERNPSAFDDKFRGSPTPSQYRPAYSPPSTAPVWSYPPAPAVAAAPPPPPPPPPRVNKFGCKCRRSFCLKKVRNESFFVGVVCKNPISHQVFSFL
jgi:hypothetical protein